MILYKNPNNKSSSNYDQVYSFDEERFSHEHTFSALEIVRDKFFKKEPVQYCIDIGCGQGQVLDYVYRQNCNQYPETTGDGYIGVDLSRVAIEQSNKRNPNLMWVCDTYQEMLSNEDFHSRLIGKVDLIINKGGLTFINDELEYVNTLKQTREYLRDDGIFMVMLNKGFYQHWNLVSCRNWQKDIFEYANEIIGSEKNLSTNASHIYCFVKSGATVNPICKAVEERTSVAISIQSRDNINSYRIFHDTLTQERLHCLRANRENRSPVTVPIPDRLNERAKEKRITTMDLIQSRSRQGLLNVAICYDALRFLDGSAVPISDMVSIAGEGLFNITSFPEGASSSRRLKERIFNLLALDCSSAVIGVGFKDFYLDVRTKQAHIDLDEYQLNMDYILCKMSEYGMKAIVLLPSVTDEVEHKGLVSCENLTESYREITRNLCKVYGASYFELRDHISRGLRGEAKKQGYAIASSLAKYIDNVLVEDTPTFPTPKPLPSRQNHIPDSISILYHSGDQLNIQDHRREGIYFSLPFTNEQVNHDEGSRITGGKSICLLGGRGEFESYLQRELVAWLYAYEKTGLQSCMIIGDSIRMRIADSTGYGRYAYRQLLGKLNLYHIPHNCGGTKVHRQYLEDWIQFGPEIVHINAGLHDLTFSFTGDKPTASYNSPDEYAENIRWIVETLRKNGVSTVIWGLNTPVHEEWHKYVPGTGKKRKIGRKNDTIRLYNDVARDVMRDLDVPVTDMFTPLWQEGVDKVLLPDGVHLNHRGSQILGELVASAVLKYRS